YAQDKDQVFLYTDDGNFHSAKPYYSPDSGAQLAQAITDYSSKNSGNYYKADVAIRDVLNEIEGSSNICQRPKFLLLVVGDDVIDDDLFAEIAQRTKDSHTKLVVFHTPTVSGRKLNDETVYRSFAEGIGGYYISIASNNSSSFFNLISSHRQIFSTSYHSNSSESGTHSLEFIYKGKAVRTKGDNSYMVSLLAPQVTLIAPSIIERIATQTADAGYLYDKSAESITLEITFPDAVSRKIDTAAFLLISQAGNPEVRVPVTLSSSSEGNYQFVWSFGDIGDKKQNDFVIRVEIVDELKLVSTSSGTQVTILSYVPLIYVTERYLVYILLGVVIILIVLVVIVWRRGGKGVQLVKKVAGDIRKTIVGGGTKGKSLATLNIIAGPTDMIGKDLKIYTERVKLGRDPQLADMTFYTPDAKSSISGLHASIEKANGLWRIVAVSTSKSETFVDDAAIPFNQPCPLNNGQTVRLGYLAQQPVTFTFNTDTQSDAPRKTNIVGDDDINKTDVSPDTMPFGTFKQTGTTELGQETDDIFDEFRA
ncbi:MAG: FHA domain-containing protein, partial [Candidatus Methanofastidiosia archaeon]